MPLLLGVLLAAALAAGVLGASDAGWFEPYFGGLDPVLATLVVVVLGSAALALLRSRGLFVLEDRRAERPGMGPLAVLGLVFAVGPVALDLAAPFPRDINVPLPEAVLFYPLMGLVAEAVFHVIPLAALGLLLEWILDERRREAGILLAAALVALVEPTFQLAMGGAEGIPAWARAALWIHLAAFGGVQLWTFRRRGFAHMYALRLFYYLLWHIVWGYLRLHTLF